MQVAKSSDDTCNVPLHDVEAVLVSRVKVFIGLLKVTANVMVGSCVLEPSAGVRLLTANAAGLLGPGALDEFELLKADAIEPVAT